MQWRCLPWRCRRPGGDGSAGGLRVDMQLTIVDAHHQAAFSLPKCRVRCRVCRLPVGPATDGSLELMRRGGRSNVALSQKPRPGSISRSVLVSLHTTILYVLPGFIQWEDGSTAATTTHSLSSVTVSEAIACPNHGAVCKAEPGNRTHTSAMGGGSFSACPRVSTFAVASSVHGYNSRTSRTVVESISGK